MTVFKSIHLKSKLLLLFCSVNLLALLAACSSTATTAPANAPTVTATTAPVTIAPPSATAVVPQAVIDTPFKIKYNQEIELNFELLKVKFVSVTNDSRCPKDVSCAWSGAATVNLMVQKEGEQPNPVSLTIYGSSGAPKGENIAKIGSYSIKLDTLDPARSTKTEIKNTDYVATLIVARVS